MLRPCSVKDRRRRLSMPFAAPRWACPRRRPAEEPGASGGRRTGGGRRRFASGVGRRGAGLEQGGADGSEKNGFHGSLLFSRGLLMETAFYGRKIDYLSDAALRTFQSIALQQDSPRKRNATFSSLCLTFYHDPPSRRCQVHPRSTGTAALCASFLLSMTENRRTARLPGVFHPHPLLVGINCDKVVESGSSACRQALRSIHYAPGIPATPQTRQ